MDTPDPEFSRTIVARTGPAGLGAHLTTAQMDLAMVQAKLDVLLDHVARLDGTPTLAMREEVVAAFERRLDELDSRIEDAFISGEAAIAQGDLKYLFPR